MCSPSTSRYGQFWKQLRGIAFWMYNKYWLSRSEPRSTETETWGWDCLWFLHEGGLVTGAYIKVGPSTGHTWFLHEGGTVHWWVHTCTLENSVNTLVCHKWTPSGYTVWCILFGRILGKPSCNHFSKPRIPTAVWCFCRISKFPMRAGGAEGGGAGGSCHGSAVISWAQGSIGMPLFSFQIQEIALRILENLLDTNEHAKQLLFHGITPKTMTLISVYYEVGKHNTPLACLTQGHRGQRSSIGRFSLRKSCKPTALHSNLWTSSLYIDLHDGHSKTTTSQARESWFVFKIILLLTRTRTNACARLRCDVVLRYPSWIRVSFM